MSKLIVTDGKDVLDTIELTSERITIGRHPDNSLQLNDKAVSGHHAVIVNIMSESFLEDLDSTIGTLVNGRRIAKHPLSTGDVITMGHHTLKYEADVQIDEDALEKTMILRPGELASATGETLGSAAAAAPATPTKPQVGVLTLTSGANAGKQLQLTKALTTVGRPGVQVAAVTRRPDGYYIVHVGGQKDQGLPPPSVNGESIGGHARQLTEGDEIKLAGATLSFSLIDA